MFYEDVFMPYPYGSFPADAAGVDPIAHPTTIAALRAPNSQDIQPQGTQWFDNSVNPPVQYTTVGGGVWNTRGTLSSLVVAGPTTFTGVSNINTSGAAATNIGTGGTGAVNIGNATGNTAVTGSMTVSGDITTSGGNVIINGAAKQLRVKGGAVTDFIGTGTLVAGTVTIANTNIAATDRIFVQRTAANASTTMGEIVYTISAGASFTVTSLILGTPGSTQTGDLSSFTYHIVRQV